jgi:hypothetical protein
MFDKIRNIFNNLYSLWNRKEQQNIIKPIQKQKAYNHFSNLINNNNKITFHQAILDYEDTDETDFHILAKKRNLSTIEYMDTYKSIFNSIDRNKPYGTFS